MITRRSMLAATGVLATLTAGGQITAAATPGVAGKRRTEAMQITRSDSQPSRIGPPESFTGAVRIDTPFRGTSPARVGGAFVTFEPGARTAWHTHPLGQTLYVVSGCGRAQSHGGPIREIRAGDIVWFAPGEKHWHGATPNTGMVHIAMQEAVDGKAVEWLEHVTDEEYGRKVG
jgi:quercetin dioxygenase-like cupin family protein